MSAATSGMPEVVAEILKYRPDVNTKNQAGQTALFAAATHWFNDETARGTAAEVVRMLIKAGADPNFHDKDGNTALHNTYVPDIARALMGAGADVNARNLAGETPLMKTTSFEIARMLLENGADLSAHDDSGHTALELAKRYARSDIANVLEAAQGSSQKK
jgi:ankyrin repeat protein